MKKKTKTTILLIVSFFAVICLSIFGTLYFTGFLTHRNNFARGNFQLNQSQIDDVTSFFNSNPNLTDAQNYCTNNRASCFYYCRTINPNGEICSQMTNFRAAGQGGTP